MQTDSPPFRVRYADTDAQAVAYYGSYFTWLEVGELHLLESQGIDVPALDRQGLLLTCAESCLRYRRPAVYDDSLVVRACLAEAAPKRVLFEYQILRAADGQVLAEGRLADVFVAPAGTVEPVPEPVADLAERRVERVTASARAEELLGPPPPGAPTHVCDIQVRYAETDAQGVAYYGSYYAWFEEGRNELTRRCGLPYSELERRRVFLPVTEAYCRYLAPLRARETFRMTTAVPKLGRAKVTFTNRMTSTDGGQALAAGYTIHGCTGPDGRPRGLAPEIIEHFGPSP